MTATKQRQQACWDNLDVLHGEYGNRVTSPPESSKVQFHHDFWLEEAKSTLRRFSHTRLGDCAASMGFQMPFCL